MNYALILLDKRKQELLDSREWNNLRLKKGERGQTGAQLEKDNVKLERCIREIDEAILCVNIITEMYEKRVQGIDPKNTNFSDYLKKWISDKP